jgi:Fe-S cluster assembly iron-binding protein IscA
MTELLEEVEANVAGMRVNAQTGGCSGMSFGIRIINNIIRGL